MDKLRIFDFDDTIAFTKAKINVSKQDGTKLVLTPAQYAVYVPQAGDDFDYSEFQKLIEPEEITWITKILKSVINKRGVDGAVVLTARSADAPVYEFFDSMKIPKIPVVALADANPDAKVQWIYYIIKKFKPSVVEFFDDSYKNAEAAKKLAKKVEAEYGTKLIVHHVVHKKESGHLMSENQKEFGQHIIHIEDLKPNQLLNVLKTLNVTGDKSGLVVTEKMDGFFMSFGQDQSGFYAGTKNTQWRGSNDFPDLYFLAGLKSYISKLEHLNIFDITQKAFRLKTPIQNSVRITGESIPSYDHNIVMYDPGIVGDGIFVIYQITVDDKQVTDPRLIQNWIKTVQSQTTVKFFSNPQVALSYKVPKKILVNLEKLIAKNGNIFAKPAKTPEDKILKQALMDKIKELGMATKQGILKSPYKPVFGGDFEGFVLHMPDGSMVKIIDKDKFTKAKEKNWYFIDQLQDAEREFKRSTKEDPANLETHVKSFMTNVANVKKDFEQNADSFIDIPKKKQDTVEELKLYARKLAKLIELIKQKKLSNEQIVDMYNKRQINEGGNAFASINSHVQKDFLDSTISKALESIDLGDIDYKVVGNASKPILGDIDIALNIKDLIKKYNLDTTSEDSVWHSLNEVLKSYGSKLEFTVNKGFKQFHIVTVVVDKDGNEQFAIDQNGQMKEPKQVAKVQLDFFLGSIKWMTNVLSGSPANSAYKAYYRNVLLRSIVSRVKNPKNPNERYVIDFKNGVDLVKFEIVPPTGKQKKEQENILSRKQYLGDANILANWLFGPTHTWEDINSFEELAMLLQSSDFQFPEYRKEIIEKFKTEVAKDKKPIAGKEFGIVEEEVTLNQSEKTIGLIVGGFKPFHIGHYTAVKMASDACDKVFVLASVLDRKKGEGVSMTGRQSEEFMRHYILPILPANVEVIFTNKPYQELLTILHDKLEPIYNNVNVIIYGDKEDLLANFGGTTYKKLLKYVPNIIANNKLKLEQTPRVASGTQVRKAIANRDVQQIDMLMPKELHGKAEEILNFFNNMQ